MNLQKAVCLKPTGMANKVLPLPNEPAVGGSTDVGDVSWIVPTMGDGGVAEAGQRVIAP